MAIGNGTTQTTANGSKVSHEKSTAPIANGTNVETFPRTGKQVNLCKGVSNM